MHPLDRFIHRRTNGRHTFTSVVTGLPVVNLTAIGAKSGQPRTIPLIGIPDGDDIVLIASNWGQTRHPAWYHNLRANPEATLTLNGRKGAYIAREAAPEERDRYWQRALDLYVGYAAYESRTGGRQIPIMVLTPKHG